MEELSPQIQQQIAQFQAVQQQAQAIASQKMQMELQLKDAERAMEELKKVKKDTDIYKSIGTLLIKSDKGKIDVELKEKKETFELRIKALQRQEGKIRAKLTELQTNIQNRIKSGQPPAG